MARLARTLFWLALAFALVIAWQPHPPQTSVGDKWQHMAAFATLTILAAAGFPDAALQQIGERLSFVGAMVEVVQSIPALHRDCDIMDWVADTAVIVWVPLVIGYRRYGVARRTTAD